MLYRVRSAITKYIPDDTSFEANSPVACIEGLLKEKGYTAKNIEKVGDFSFSNVIVKSKGKREFISHYQVSGITKIESKGGTLKEYEISLYDYGIEMANGMEHKVSGVTNFARRLEKLNIKKDFGYGKMYLASMKDFYKVFNKALVDDLKSCGVDDALVDELKKTFLDSIVFMEGNGYYDSMIDYYKKFVAGWTQRFMPNTHITPPIFYIGKGYFEATMPIVGNNFHNCYISIKVRETRQEQEV